MSCLHVMGRRDPPVGTLGATYAVGREPRCSGAARRNTVEEACAEVPVTQWSGARPAWSLQAGATRDSSPAAAQPYSS
jgi:hypothetical protein